MFQDEIIDFLLIKKQEVRRLRNMKGGYHGWYAISVKQLLNIFLTGRYFIFRSLS